MTKISQPILFFGTEDFSLIALQALVEKGFPVAVVITKPDTKKGRGHKLVPPAVKTYAAEHNIPVWQPEKLHDIVDDIKKIHAPVGVLVSYGKIIPQSIIDFFVPGIINVHPSLLPLYRGPSPIEAAILSGDNETGVSIMQLSARMDAGPVYLQESIPLTQTETAPELYRTLGHIGAKLLTDHLPAILDGTLVPVEQHEASASYCSLITKQNGYIDWSVETADTIERKVRAYQPWPQCRASIGHIDVILTSLDVNITSPIHVAPGTISVRDNQLSIATKVGTIRINTLKPLGKKEMSADAFINGYRHLLR